MGAALARLLQRAVPALKEQQKALQALQNQTVIKEQELVNLREQKDLIEQHVGVLTTELTAAQILIKELKWDADTKRKLIAIGLGVGVAALVWMYVRRNQEHQEEDEEEDNLLDMRVDIAVPDTLECIICMEGMKEVMMEPCGHVCCCRNCAMAMRNNNRLRCPVCRGSSDFRTVFIS
eukprot:TRINITY_DN20289_c0_g1_i1.p1 TRINITY_DN20289_c0_g1~~TRINITY_DN20289_c0_g1_i1.p1  ORF type:complete len:178 (-),score=58.34 TRINITY_DN20289_c0_g1_i1:107-640(-)